MKPTKEQERIFHFIKNRQDNILIEALAGSGKTTTLVHASKLLDKSKRILFLAFNKHIQEELKEKLPDYIKCYTTYGLGYSAVKRKYPDIEFDEYKVDKIINKKSSTWNLDEEFSDYEEKSFYLRQLKKLVNHCRLTVTLDKKFIPYLSDKHELGLNRPEDIKRVLKILDVLTTDRKSMDFIDMIFLPAIDNGIWMYPFDYVLVDEIQDFNRAQIKIVEKVLKRDRKFGNYTGRLISVGDFHQAIYGFNSSDERSFEWFRRFQNTKTLPLSVSFRCPKKVIETAQRLVPNIKSLDDAPEGIVRSGDVINEAMSGDLVLCRTTVPLIHLFFEFLVQKKKVFIRGADIGENMIELIGEIKTINELISHWENELEVKRKQLYKMGVLNPSEDAGFSNLEDRVSTLLFLAKGSRDIPDLITTIKKIFSDDKNLDGIILSTIHKAKGSEANRVFIIRKDQLPMANVRGWQYVQELNLEYIAYTRAKMELVIDYKWTNEEND